MTSKRVSFDLMNLGFPVHTDPLEVERLESRQSVRKFSNVGLADESLRAKLAEEAKNRHTDFLLRDPSSSDDSDDCAFPETIHEQVRRLCFDKRRKQHYTEFTTVDLARRLVCAEFASVSSSVNSEDSDFHSPTIEEKECPPCWSQSTESFPFRQYIEHRDTSHGSDESALKEELEPGSDPTHPCFHKLSGELNSPILRRQDRGTPAANEQMEPITYQLSAPSMMSIADVNRDLQESLEKHRGERWEMQQTQPHPHPLFPQTPPKVTRVADGIRSEKWKGTPLGPRSA